MGHDDMHRKTTRFSPHAHDPMSRTWADDFNSLALDNRYEKSAAPFSKRRGGVYQGVDMSASGFFGPFDNQIPADQFDKPPIQSEQVREQVSESAGAVAKAAVNLAILLGLPLLAYRYAKKRA